MDTLKQYKCPSCDGAIEFDTQTQKMKCPYCDSEFDVQSLLSHDEVLKNAKPDNMVWEKEPGSEWKEGETEGLRIYSCKTCGGEVVTDETTGATSCPFCGNPIVMMGQFAGMLKPDYVIPFKYDKKAAIAALKKHYGGKTLLPKAFSKQNHIDEVKGVYIPVWLFDAEADANVQYKACITRTWSDSQYHYTENRYYSVDRSGNMCFEKVPVDGSSKMDDTLMESIEPFDFSKAVDFQTAYLSGYLADKYDVDSTQSITKANERIKKSVEDAFASTVNGYNSVDVEFSSVNLQNSSAKYALYPVWLLNTSWNGKKYSFAMNGQTGKFVGDLPLDKGAYFRWFASLTGIVTVVTFAISYLLWLL